MRALGYFVLSSDQEATGLSLATQQESFRAYCARYDHRTVSFFVDDPLTIQNGRTGYQEMLTFIQSSAEAFLVVVCEIASLGETLAQVVTRLVELDSLKSQVASTDPEFPDPLQNALSVFEDPKSRKIRDGMAKKAALGVGLGKPPYGYSIDAEGKLEVLPHQAQIVQRIFLMYVDENLGMRRITHTLNEENALRTTGQLWNVVAILDILRNPVYQGTYQRFGFRIPGNHPTIISPDLFRRAQNQTRSRRTYRKEPNMEPFLLSGLVTCGICGSRMIGVTRRQTWRTKDGSRKRRVYRYYQCQARTNQGVCEYGTRRAEDLEAQIIAKTRFLLQKTAPDSFDAYPEEQNLTSRLQTENPLLHKTEKAWRRRWLKAVRYAGDGGMSLTRLRYVLDDLAQEYLPPIPPDFQGPAVNIQEFFLSEQLWNDLRFSHQRLLLRRFVQSITVHRTSFETTLNRSPTPS